MTFRIGQQVQCVGGPEAFRGGYGDETKPVKGNIYTVRGIRGFSIGVFSAVGIVVEEIHNEARLYLAGMIEVHFHVVHFRPVHKTDISIFTAMLTPKKVDA